MRILSSVSKVRPQSVCVVRNNLTGLSRGYALVECSSLQDSSIVLEACHGRPYPIEIEGKAVIVTYAKNTFKTLLVFSSNNIRLSQYVCFSAYWFIKDMPLL